MPGWNKGTLKTHFWEELKSKSIDKEIINRSKTQLPLNIVKCTMGYHVRSVI